MMFIKRFPSLILAVLFLLLVLGCSSNETDPITPDVKPEISASQTNRILWGLWEISFDADGTQLHVEPVRNAIAHFDVTDVLIPPGCADCIGIYNVSFNPVTRILDARVNLRNPSVITGYDIRGILFTDDAGHELRNADGWTGLWDIPGGEDINPFKAFAKSNWQRAFPSGATFNEDYQVYIPTPPQYNTIRFAVDASWPGNCKEPYAIEYFTQTELADAAGSTADVQVAVLDWQADVDSVTLRAPEITGEDATPFTHSGGHSWVLELTNNMGATAGLYGARISATSSGSGSLALYDYVTIVVKTDGVPINPVDVTPPWLCFYPMDVCIIGSYAYVAEDFHGLSIYEIIDPVEWSWVANVRTPYPINTVVVNGDYAYVTSLEGRLSVIDIDPPESAYLVSNVATGARAYDLAVADGYAYVAAGLDDFYIVDVDPPESAHVAGFLETPGYATTGVDVCGEYAYITEGSGGLHIVDISTPESPYIVNTVNLLGYQFVDVTVKDGYAFVEIYGAKIFDIDPPEDAHYVEKIYGSDENTFVIEGNYLYMMEYEQVDIYDITDPESPNKITSVELPKKGRGIGVGGGYAYVFGYWTNDMYVVDVDPPEAASFTGTYEMPVNVGSVYAGTEYVYAVDGYDGFVTYDIDPLESASIISIFPTSGDGSLVVEGYNAYLPSLYGGLVILNLTNPEYPSVTKTIETPGNGREVAVQSGYAYLAAGEAGLVIIDVDPVWSAYVVNIVDVFQYTWTLAVDGDYAYVGDGDVGLQIIDINPPESAHIVKSVGPMGKVCDVAFDGGYAFVTDSSAGLRIVDVDPPESASIIKTVGTPEPPYGLAIDGGYAYVTASPDHFYVIDIDPVESAHLFASVDISGYVRRVSVRDNYAYVGGSISGLRVIKLW